MVLLGVCACPGSDVGCLDSNGRLDFCLDFYTKFMSYDLGESETHAAAACVCVYGMCESQGVRVSE